AFLGEPEEDVARLRRAQLQRDALLVARIELPARGNVPGLPRAQRVSRRGLDLDHFGAEIREHAREHVARDEPRELEHAKPVAGPAVAAEVVALFQLHSGLMFASFATFFQPSISSRIVRANSRWLMGAGSAPSRRNTSLSSGVARSRFTSALIFAR